MPPPPGIVLNGATSQYDRWPVALDPALTPVDGRTYPQLLDFAPQYGALIRYYDFSNQPDGDWTNFFLDDPTMRLASIVAMDPVAIEARYLELQRATRKERHYPAKFELLRATFAYILNLGRSYAAVLRDSLRTLQSYDEGAGLPEALGRAIGLDYSGLDLGCVCPDGAPYRGATKPRRIDHALPWLDPIFYAVLDEIEDAQRIAREQLPSSLATGMHKPHIALYMAFVQLFSTVQNTLNTFTSRFTEFYYERILRERPASAIGDDVFLTFTLEPQEDATSTNVPAETLFVAGQDADGNEILYAADRSLAVTSAAITSLVTLRVLRDARFREMPERVVMATIPVDANEPWPTFGSDSDPNAPLGFAIASHALLLQGGQRHIELTFTFTDCGLRERLAVWADETGLLPATIFTTVMHAAFTTFASSTEAWFPLPPYDVSTVGEEQFVLSYQLPESAPPIVAFAEAPVPSIQFWLRQEAVVIRGVSIYPLTMLATVQIDAVDIFTDVTGLSDVTIETTDGPVDATAPFPAFGGLPVVGSYLQLRSVELFSKTPETLQLNVEWFGLPPNDNGFQGWYRDYVIGLNGTREEDLFDNTTFRGDLAVWKPGAWNVATSESPLASSPVDGGVYLFRTTNYCLDPVPQCDLPVCGETLFDSMTVVPADAPAYYDPASSALRLTLTSPPYSFGSSIYPPNVLAAVLADLPDVGGCQEECASEYAPLQLAAARIGQCILECRDTNPLDDCLAHCLAGVVADLLAAAEDCMRQCRQEASPPDDLCHAKCLLMADMAAMLDQCLQASPPVDLETCALECQRKIKEAYSAAVAACVNVCMSPRKDLHYPNDPYLPMVQSVRVDYSARSIDVALSHLTPIAGEQPVALPGSLLPQLACEAALTLEWNALSAGVLTLLFQTTAAEQTIADPPAITWSIDDRTLDAAQVLSDTTNGLRGTGIVTFDLPAAAKTLRASVARDASSFPRTLAITPHVLTAKWQPGTSSGATLARPLAAGTITSAVQDLPLIATIEQPLESFGGRPPEDQRAFQTRLGERLRHKDRAILAWDYVRLVLERFPSVWKAAVLPPASPGEVVVVVVAGSDSIAVVDPTVPVAPQHQLTQIRCYLQSLVSPFVQLRVVNPYYVRIEVSVEVEFAQTVAGDRMRRLNDDLVQYLSPWFYDAERAAKGGRYANEDEISEFVQTRDYVLAMQSISFRYTPDPAELDWYFLTSAPAHVITEITDAGGDPCGRIER